MPSGNDTQGRTRKRKHGYWNQSTKQKWVEPGLSGLFFTCHGDEKRAVTEAYKLIDELHKYDPTDQVDDDDEDALEKQCAVLRDAHKNNEMRKQRPTGVKNCLFVHVPGADTTDLSMRMVDLCQKEPNTRFLDRVIPVEKTAAVDLPKLNEMVFEMVQKHLKVSDGPPLSYSMEFKARNNDIIKRQNVMEMVNDAIMAICPSARANLGNPDVTFFVQIVRKTMMVGTLLGYGRRRKYSLRPLEEVEQNKERERKRLEEKRKIEDRNNEKKTEQERDDTETERKNTSSDENIQGGRSCISDDLSPSSLQ